MALSIPGVGFVTVSLIRLIMVIDKLHYWNNNIEFMSIAYKLVLSPFLFVTLQKYRQNALDAIILHRVKTRRY
jgi:hypothetical protein